MPLGITVKYSIPYSIPVFNLGQTIRMMKRIEGGR